MRPTIFALVQLIMVSLLLGCDRPTQKEDHYVVVLSMDGFRSDYTRRAHTPTLDSIGQAGVKGAFRPCYPSVTFPNHYSMATGLYPDHHGLINNTFYDAQLDSVYDMSCKDPRFYGGEPIWNTAERQGIKSAVYYWVGSEVKLPSGQPSILKPFDSSTPFTDRADSVIAWLRRPVHERPRLIMWYMEEPDAIGHAATPDSITTLQKVEELDQILGRFFREARELDIYEKIDFIVLSDHGMATFYPDKCVNLNDYLPRDSFKYVFEGVPTLLYVKNKSYIEQAYQILQKVPNITVWKKDDIPSRLIYGKNPRVGDLVVASEIGAIVQFREKPVSTLGGAHGYDNYAPEMEAIFYAMGPSFKKGAVAPAIPNVNLYLLLSHLLNIKPQPNDGDTISINYLLAKPIK